MVFDYLILVFFYHSDMCIFDNHRDGWQRTAAAPGGDLFLRRCRHIERFETALGYKG